MKLLLSFIKFLIYSNLFVSTCVVAFTHLTYIIYDLPKTNMYVILIMVFCFTFFTYNGQRLFRLKNKSLPPEKIGERLQWVINNKQPITIFSLLFAALGLGCIFFINPYDLFLLIPMGILSVFYVIPILPFYKKSPTLRDLPYAKIFIIALVWSLVIIGLPFVESTSYFSHGFDIEHLIRSIVLCSTPVFFFVVGITIPFDVRDMSFDKKDALKTIPNVFGVKKSIVIAELGILISMIVLGFIHSQESGFYGIIVGHFLTMILVWFSGKKRKELFYSGLIESTVIVLYLCVIGSNYLFYPMVIYP